MSKYRIEYGYDSDAKWQKDTFDADTDELAVQKAKALNKKMGGTYSIVLYRIEVVEQTKHVWNNG